MLNGVENERYLVLSEEDRADFQFKSHHIECTL